MIIQGHSQLIFNVTWSLLQFNFEFCPERDIINWRRGLAERRTIEHKTD